MSCFTLETLASFTAYSIHPFGLDYNVKFKYKTKSRQMLSFNWIISIIFSVCFVLLHHLHHKYCQPHSSSRHHDRHPTAYRRLLWRMSVPA